MALGGVYDQLGGGFYRYSVDARWMIPHFEKMLYDNALLLPLYCEAWQITGSALFERAALETAAWAMREMQSPEGGFYSSLDADSEGEEGRYYVWTPQQVRTLLDDDQYAAFSPRYGLDREANFEEHWHLYAAKNAADIAAAIGKDEREIDRLVDQARRALWTARETRVRPGRDDKVLTSWNALMIRGMAVAARTFGRTDCLQSARRAADFIRSRLWRDGRLLATYKDGRAHLAAYLDDHAFLLDASLELLQTAWRTEDLDFAISLADALLERFEDADGGGFFFTAHDHETLLRRLKPFGDDALPAGNARAALALQRLGHLIGESRYLDAAARAVAAAWPHVAELPYAHDAMLDALGEYLEPPQLIVIRGGGDLAEWLRICRTGYHPQRLSFAIDVDVAGLPGLLAERRASASGAVAYVCSGTSCQAPVHTIDQLHQAIGGTG